MSADNTILIAEFPNGEYRAAEGGADENLDLPELGDLYRVLWFKDAPIFKTIEAAVTYAEKLETDCGYVEYGIRRVRYDRDLLDISVEEAGSLLGFSEMES